MTIKQIDEAELAICKRRGHSFQPDRYWHQCKFCGLWIREIRTVVIEELRTTPPENEVDPMEIIQNLPFQFYRYRDRIRR